MQKKYILSLMMLGLGFTLASCSGNNEEIKPTTTETTTITTTESKTTTETIEVPTTTETVETPTTTTTVEVSVSSIHVEGAKALFDLNEDFSTEGLVVKALMSDDSTVEVSATLYQVDSSKYDKEKTGTYTIKVTYEGKEATYDVTVKGSADLPWI